MPESMNLDRLSSILGALELNTLAEFRFIVCF
jgi:hypothetical protein